MVTIEQVLKGRAPMPTPIRIRFDHADLCMPLTIDDLEQDAILRDLEKALIDLENDACSLPWELPF